VSKDKQSIDHLKSEIRFREKLARQHVDGEVLIDNYIRKEDHDAMMWERVNTTIIAMKGLKEEGVTLSPFIEVGAERGQRSLVLANDFGAKGFAVDLSLEQLKTLDYWKEFFKKPELPMRVCCNIYSLPFQENSFRFAFCYQFLHHFPSLEPVFREIKRVIAPGQHFFFAEEPYKRYSLNLYRRKINNKPGKIRKILTYLESFIAHQYEVEEEHGIIENDEISLDQWLDALSIFTGKKVYLYSAASLFRSEMSRVSTLRIRLHRMLGGGINALVKKAVGKGGIDNGEERDLYDLLACPECLSNKPEKGLDRAPLKKHGDYLKCRVCEREYPIVDNVIMLLPYPEMKELYPQVLK